MKITGTPLYNPGKFYSNCVEVLISSLKIWRLQHYLSACRLLYADSTDSTLVFCETSVKMFHKCQKQRRNWPNGVWRLTWTRSASAICWDTPCTTNKDCRISCETSVKMFHKCQKQRRNWPNGAWRLTWTWSASAICWDTPCTTNILRWKDEKNNILNHPTHVGQTTERADKFSETSLKREILPMLKAQWDGRFQN